MERTRVNTRVWPRSGDLESILAFGLEFGLLSKRVNTTRVWHTVEWPTVDQGEIEGLALAAAPFAERGG
eukprot:3360188-Rhodomonas_salina.4